MNVHNEELSYIHYKGNCMKKEYKIAIIVSIVLILATLIVLENSRGI